MTERPAYLTHHILERSAKHYPDKEAIVDGKRRFDYKSFLEHAETIASVLLEQGIQRRDRVAFFIPKNFEQAAAIFGVSMAGGVFVPINPLLKPAQVRHILADCGVRFLITMATRWDGMEAVVSDVESLERVLLTDAPRRSEDPRLVPEVFSEMRKLDYQSPCIGEDLGAILYTSGSTGQPKGVMLSHRVLLGSSRISSLQLHICHEERILAVLPFSFDYGLNQLMIATDLGATVILLNFRFGNEIVKALKSEKATGLSAVPTIWAVLTHGTPSFKDCGFDDLRYVTNSGGALPTETVRAMREAMPKTDVYLMYGFTEAFRTAYLDPKDVDEHPTCMGGPLPETEVLVVSEEGKLCGPGETGYLMHRGPTISMGYWGKPEETASLIRDNPLLDKQRGADRVAFPGDLVRIGGDGRLYFLGRDNAMIKCQGFRVGPTEVEEVLMKSGVLAQAAVIGLPDPAADERVYAVVVPQGDEEPDKQKLRTHCARELPGFMIPYDIEFIADLPRLPRGKVDYKKLRAERVHKYKS